MLYVSPLKEPPDKYDDVHSSLYSKGHLHTSESRNRKTKAGFEPYQPKRSPMAKHSYQRSPNESYNELIREHDTFGSRTEKENLRDSDFEVRGTRDRDLSDGVFKHTKSKDHKENVKVKDSRRTSQKDRQTRHATLARKTNDRSFFSDNWREDMRGSATKLNNSLNDLVRPDSYRRNRNSSHSIIERSSHKSKHDDMVKNYEQTDMQNDWHKGREYHNKAQDRTQNNAYRSQSAEREQDRSQQHMVNSKRKNKKNRNRNQIIGIHDQIESYETESSILNNNMDFERDTYQEYISATKIKENHTTEMKYSNDQITNMTSDISNTLDNSSTLHQTSPTETRAVYMSKKGLNNNNIQVELKNDFLNSGIIDHEYDDTADDFIEQTLSQEVSFTLEKSQLEIEQRRKEQGIMLLECTCTADLSGRRIKHSEDCISRSNENCVEPSVSERKDNLNNSGNIYGSSDNGSTSLAEQKETENQSSIRNEITSQSAPVSRKASSSSPNFDNFRSGLIHALAQEIDRRSSKSSLASKSSLSSLESGLKRKSTNSLNLSNPAVDDNKIVIGEDFLQVISNEPKVVLQENSDQDVYCCDDKCISKEEISFSHEDSVIIIDSSGDENESTSQVTFVKAPGDFESTKSPSRKSLSSQTRRTKPGGVMGNILSIHQENKERDERSVPEQISTQTERLTSQVHRDSFKEVERKGNNEKKARKNTSNSKSAECKNIKEITNLSDKRIRRDSGNKNKQSEHEKQKDHQHGRQQKLVKQMVKQTEDWVNKKEEFSHDFYGHSEDEKSDIKRTEQSHTQNPGMIVSKDRATSQVDQLIEINSFDVPQKRKSVSFVPIVDDKGETFYRLFSMILEMIFIV